ncbi:MAG: O-acetylhomoserine aminocarboxypropyltransferase/cysteine synthase [Desulfobulbaceae bacterium]|nr:O-acetylhomoserine aminocarboxypropyltransferase/cysteine synthase [Desulfobulbaceae bacterium]
MATKNWKLETIAVQGGYDPANGDPRVVPLVQSTTYAYDSAQNVADFFDLKAVGHFYTRISNPTVAAFEAKMTMLESGVGALACASGQAAITYALLNICQAGQHIVATQALYGGTFNLLSQTLPKLGITCTFVDQHAPATEIAAAIQDNTRCLLAESLSNPGTEVLDFDKFTTIAREAGIPLIVDNTFPTPHLCRPIEFGADIVVHSSSKYIDGHATSLGGVIIDGGQFDWTNGKFPEMTEPDPSYHGLSYSESFGNSAYIVKARVQLTRDIGAVLAPMNAWLSNLGLETLHLRMERHSSNTTRLAEWLAADSRIQWVKYPGLKTDANYALAQRYLKGASGVLTFGVQGGIEAGERFMNSLKLARLVVHVADVRTSVLHPASMTHRQLTAAQQMQAGIRPELIRVSVGLEHIDDIIADFDQALSAATKA